MTDKNKDALEALDDLERKFMNNDLGAVDFLKSTIAIRAALTAQEWQRIETAPRDGTYVLTCIAGEGGSVVTDCGYDFGFCADDFGRKATHWMPLPAAPE